MSKAKKEPAAAPATAAVAAAAAASPKKDAKEIKDPAAASLSSDPFVPGDFAAQLKFLVDHAKSSAEQAKATAERMSVIERQLADRPPTKSEMKERRADAVDTESAKSETKARPADATKTDSAAEAEDERALKTVKNAKRAKRRREKKQRESAGLPLLKSMAAAGSVAAEPGPPADDDEVEGDDSGHSDDGFADKVAVASGARDDAESDLSDDDLSGADTHSVAGADPERSQVPGRRKKYPAPVPPEMVRPSASSRPIPKWMWRLQRYDLPDVSLGRSWYLPRMAEQAYRVHSSFAAWAAAKVKSTAKEGPHADRNVQEAAVLARILDSVAAGDVAFASETAARRLQALKEYSHTAKSGWLHTLSTAGADDMPVPPDEYTEQQKRVDKYEKEKVREKGGRGVFGAGRGAGAGAAAARFGSSADAGKAAASKSAPAGQDRRRGKG